MVVGGVLALDEDDQFDAPGSPAAPGGEQVSGSNRDNGAQAAVKAGSVSQNQKAPNIIYLMTVLSAMGGFLFGYDTGIVSGAMVFVKDVFSLDKAWQEIVVSITIVGAWVLSLLAGGLSEIYGRKRLILVASVIFTIGSVVMGVAWTKYILLFGRLIVGVAIGLASTVVPMYIAEVAPSNIRGSLVTLNNTFITFGQLAAAVTAGAFSFDHDNGWRWMLALAAIPAVIQFFGFIFMPESPRWLIRHGRNDEALIALKKIRGEKNPYLHREFEKIRQSQQELLRQEQRRKDQNRNIIVSIMRKTATRRALNVGCLLMAAQQLAGINTVMYYTATIIQMSGVQSKSIAVWLAVPTAAVYVIFSISGCLLADRMNRRTLTLGSLFGVIVSLLILGGGFHLDSMQGAHTTEHNYTTKETCSSQRDCPGCIGQPGCGFCYNAQSASFEAICLDVNPSNEEYSHGGFCSNRKDDNPYKFATKLTGMCPSVSKQGIGLSTWLVLTGLVLYLATFAPGMAPMPWTINSEIYPMWARSFCYSIATSVNWLFNLLISISFLTLTDWLTNHGTFYMYSIISSICWLLLFWKLPETRGRSLEDISTLFAKAKPDDQEIIEEDSSRSRRPSEHGMGFNQLSMVAAQMATGGHRHSVVLCHDNLAFAADNLPAGQQQLQAAKKDSSDLEISTKQLPEVMTSTTTISPTTTTTTTNP